MRHPTPITDELVTISTSLAGQQAPVDVAELKHTAEHLKVLAGRTAPLERFHAELVAEAAEEELRQLGQGTERLGEFYSDGARRR